MELKPHVYQAIGATFQQAMGFVNGRRYRDAIPLFQRVISQMEPYLRGPSDSLVRSNLSACWSNIANAHFSVGEFGKAVEAYELAHEFERFDSRPHWYVWGGIAMMHYYQRSGNRRYRKLGRLWASYGLSKRNEKDLVASGMLVEEDVDILCTMLPPFWQADDADILVSL